ncbi:MAG: hypothetical protein JST35_12320 [Armatimonadetes bacterium]|nr:hypothetical protein [Armatimonadota bacterium]
MVDPFGVQDSALQGVLNAFLAPGEPEPASSMVVGSPDWLSSAWPGIVDAIVGHARQRARDAGHAAEQAQFAPMPLPPLMPEFRLGGPESQWLGTTVFLADLFDPRGRPGTRMARTLLAMGAQQRAAQARAAEADYRRQRVEWQNAKLASQEAAKTAYDQLGDLASLVPPTESPGTIEAETPKKMPFPVPNPPTEFPSVQELAKDDPVFKGFDLSEPKPTAKTTQSAPRPPEKGPKGAASPKAHQALAKKLVSTQGGRFEQFADRNIAGTTKVSRHKFGQAIDYFNKPEVLKVTAERLTKTAGITRVIYNRRIWEPGTGWRPYKGQHPHDDHVHFEMGR